MWPTENLGDILSDESSVLPGTLGVMPSAVILKMVQVFMNHPRFGNDIAGQGIANFNDFVSIK